MTAKSKTLSKKERRDAMNKLGQKIFSDDFQYIINPIIIPDGYDGDIAALRRLDAIVLPVGPSNAEKIEKYRDALKKGIKRPMYKLGREDFMGNIMPNDAIQAANPDWSYLFMVYDFAGLGANRLKSKHIQSAEIAIQFLRMYYNLERKRVHCTLVTGKADIDVDIWTKELWDDLAEDGFQIAIAESIFPFIG